MAKLKPIASNNNNTIKFLCSYGGKIVPRHTDGLLRYSGGLTRFLAVDRSISFSELAVKLEEFCGSSSAVALRCQLPDGDLETLVTVKSDEDLKNVVEEYDRASPAAICIRAVLSAPAPLKKVASSSSIESDGSSSSPARRASSPTTQSQCSDAGRCYSPPVGYPVGLRSEAAKLRFYPWAAVGGRPRFPYRAAGHWH